MLVDIDDPAVGPYKFARTPPHLSAAPDIPVRPAPALGQHTREILEGLLGYSPADVDGFVAAGTVQLHDES